LFRNVLGFQGLTLEDMEFMGFDFFWKKTGNQTFFVHMDLVNLNVSRRKLCGKSAKRGPSQQMLWGSQRYMYFLCVFQCWSSKSDTRCKSEVEANFLFLLNFYATFAADGVPAISCFQAVVKTCWWHMYLFSTSSGLMFLNLCAGHLL
jgi:hypothetical protein